MHARTTVNVTTYALLGLTALVSFALPTKLIRSASADPLANGTTVRLTGVIRDFHKTSPDLAVVPSGGNGHYAGNINLALGAGAKPTFTGSGFKVATEWKDKNAHPIAPHLYMYSWANPNTIPVTVASPSPTHGIIDSYDSSIGAYGGANIGAPPTYVVGAPMPAIVVPLSASNLPNQGNLSYAGPKTISASIHCNRMDISGTMTISGKITIYCEDVMALATNAAINLSAGSTLRIYVKNGGSDWNHVTIGDPLNPGRVTIFNMGVTKFIVHNHADLYATVVSPNASIELSNHGSLYGRFIGKTVEYDNHGDFHVDRGPIKDACNVTLADTAGSKGAANTSGIVSAASFAKWFTDTLGANMSMQYSIDLVKNGSTYEYLNDSFNPIDNILFGNEGQSHNHYFTYTIDTKFTHHACSGTFLEFQGADDAWMFVDGQLAMDLGGVIPGTAQYVSMDRLSLVDGQTYTLQLFYAQRNASISSFRLRTNLDFVAQPATYAITGTGD